MYSSMVNNKVLGRESQQAAQKECLVKLCMAMGVNWNVTTSRNLKLKGLRAHWHSVQVMPGLSMHMPRHCSSFMFIFMCNIEPPFCSLGLTEHG